MRAQVSRWGNSLAIRLPRVAAKSLRVEEGQQVELVIKGDHIEIRAARPRYALEDLVNQITPESQPETLDFPAAGENCCDRGSRCRRSDMAELQSAGRT